MGSSFSDQTLFRNCLLGLYLTAPPTFIGLRFLQAPYGKHHRPGSGPTISPALAWFLMESPTLWLTLLIFPFGRNFSNPKSLILISPYLIHYFHRTCIYPLRLLRSNTQKGGFPVGVAFLAFVFNIVNAYLQSRWVSHYKSYQGDDASLFWWRFLIGLAIFFVGMGVNIWSDKVLVSLKKQGGGYKVPRGGWFELVSCPNYFGEILEWLGWSVMTWSWTGFAFLVYTCANLMPRARAHHQWYLEKFAEVYPKNRKAVIPFLY